jgi:hypothetical protein
MLLVAALGATPVLAEESLPYSVAVTEPAAKVGEHTTMLARIRLREGYRLLEAYNNRVSKLSSYDGTVAFDQEASNATIRDGALVFAIGLTPTKPGKHPINGVFRFGYIENGDTMKMISVPLIATVTGID